MLVVNYLVYFGSALGLLLAGMLLFALATKIKEFEEIGKGNKAVALMLGGKVLGLAVVLYAAVSNSISLADMYIWGGIGIVTQIITYVLVEWVTPKFNVNEAVQKDNVAVGIFLFILSLSIGLIIAASMSY